MNRRTKSIWFPGLISISVASVFLMILQRTGVQPHIIWLRSGLALLLYLPWLIAQPLLGAMGAYLSRRAGGERHARLAAGLFPSIAMLGTLGFGFLAGFIIDYIVRRAVPATPMFSGMAIYVCLWVVLPGVASLLGELPFLKTSKTGVLAHR